MTTLQEMLRKLTITAEHDRMIRSVAPFCNYFNINQLYYVRILSSGYCSILGTHIGLQEYMFDNIEAMKSCPVLRQPDVLSTGITFLKNTPDPIYKDFLDTSWKNFKINFTINLQKKTADGIESWGFGVKYNHPKADEHLLNELPLIHKFIDYFCEENRKLMQLSYDNQIEIASLLSPNFYEAANSYPTSNNKNLLFKQLGLSSALLLTPREMDILKFVAHGYPASHIAKKLHLSIRTIENHISNIKSKLECHSKAVLIKKALEITSVITPVPFQLV